MNNKDKQAYSVLDSLAAQPMARPFPGILERLGYTPTSARLVFNEWAETRAAEQRAKWASARKIGPGDIEALFLGR